MKAFYGKLKEAEQSKDERIVKLANVCKMDLKEVQENQALLPWDWWTK